MIKALGLALYGPLAASTRYRLAQYVQGLKEYGVELEVRHLLGDEYLLRRFSGIPPQVGPLVHSAMRRVLDLSRQRRFDVAMLYCELFPLMPGPLEASLLRLPYVYDFDDAFYLKYRGDRFRVLKALLRNKIDPIVSRAAAVTAGNATLLSYAQRHNPTAHYLPTVVDTERYRPARGEGTKKIFTVGWIGSPSTAGYLSQLTFPLSVIGKEGAVRLVVIGGKAPVINGVEVIEVPWSERSEVALINAFDVGVMPLPDTEWARGKCAFKLIQYMACGIPVIASPVGANKDVVTPECGLLASTPEEWVNALRSLRDAPAERNLMGEAGRVRIQRHYSLERNLPILSEVLRRAARRS